MSCRTSRRLSGRERAGSTSLFQDHQNSMAGRLPSVQDLAASGVIQPQTTRSGCSWFLQSQPGFVPPTRTAKSRLSIRDPAHPGPKWPDPDDLSWIRPIPGQNGRIPVIWLGFGSCPTRSLIEVEVESKIVWGAGFLVGRGARFPVDGVGIVVGRNAEFPAIRWLRRVGFKRDKRVFLSMC